MGKFKENGFKAICNTLNQLEFNSNFTIADIINKISFEVKPSYAKGVIARLISAGFVSKEIMLKEGTQIKTIKNYQKIKQIPEELNSSDLDILARTIYN